MGCPHLCQLFFFDITIYIRHFNVLLMKFKLWGCGFSHLHGLSVGPRLDYKVQMSNSKRDKNIQRYGDLFAFLSINFRLKITAGRQHVPQLCLLVTIDPFKNRIRSLQVGIMKFVPFIDPMFWETNFCCLRFFCELVR